MEIGPGLGFITERILPHVKKVIAVEKDKRLETLLKTEFSGKNVEFIFEDFLDAKLPEFNKIVSNIPYSISAPITFKLLEYDFNRAVLFFQKEFGQKMIAKAGTNDYGRLSVMAQYYFDIEFKEIVNRNSFQPQPQTDACIVVLEKKDIKRDKDFDVFVRELFRYTNKDVKNAVKIAFNKDIEDNRKVFQLTIPEIIDLYEKNENSARRI